MASWTELALDCARVARQGLRLPRGESPVAIVLGSGLGGFADSLEDRRVKRSFMEGFRAGVWSEESRDPLVADDAEIRSNARARSAKLRWVRKA